MSFNKIDRFISCTPLVLLVIFLLAITLRTVRHFEVSVKEPDVYLYVAMANDWRLHGSEYACKNSFYAWIPPLHVWLMSESYRFSMSPIEFSVLTGILLCSLMIFAAYFSALYLFDDKRYALIAAFICAIHPFLIRLSVSALKEIYFFPFFAFAVMFYLRAIKKAKMSSYYIWSLGGIFTAFATLSRKEGIVLLFLTIAWLILQPMIEMDFSKDRIIRNICMVFIVLISFMVIVLPVWFSMPSTSTWNPFLVNDPQLLKLSFFNFISRFFN